MKLSAVDLAVELIRFDTINPPGQEEACTRHLERLLELAGFSCSRVPLAEGRPNLIARIGGIAIARRRSPSPAIPTPFRSACKPWSVAAAWRTYQVTANCGAAAPPI